MKILFLYTELAGYFLSCVRELTERHPEAEVHVFRYPVNAEAPFDFELDHRIQFYDRRSFSDQELLEKVRALDPQLIYCSGWIDKGYLAAISGYSKRIPVIVGLDNKWNGNLKQRLASIAFRLILKSRFTHCWIPGEPQFNYALHLGFSPQNILKGFYSADYFFFNKLYQQSRERKVRHRFVYSGRYVPYKWVKELCELFIEIKQEQKNDWELICLGTGPQARVEGDSIKHLGFVQPEDLKEIMSDFCVFVLPSTFEPWGVVVHEFASAGMPLICSSEVGAATAFVKNGENGFVFKAGDRAALKSAMVQIMALSDQQLLKMGDISATLAGSITPEKWVKSLMSLKVK